MVMKEQLADESVRRIMSRGTVVVPLGIAVSRFVEDYVLCYRFEEYPVVDRDGLLVGVLSARAPKRLSASRWPTTPVDELMAPFKSWMTIAPDAEAMELLSALRGNESTRLVVVEEGRPVGMVGLTDLLRFLALKSDLTPR
jgi:CBS domain-containing protein